MREYKGRRTVAGTWNERVGASRRSELASPLRFRISEHEWGQGQFERRVLASLDDKFGATTERERLSGGYEGRVVSMENGDTALFAWSQDEPRAYWMGNTETPRALWETRKVSFADAPDAVADWAHNEMLDVLLDEAGWLGDYPRIAGFFLPVLMSKDGRGTTRDFLGSGAGLPNVEAEDALNFYEEVVASGVFNGNRYTMASKLGTSEYGDRVRMEATMGEFNAAKLLHDAGYDVEPEIGTETGHSLDFLARGDSGEHVVEVTRPVPPSRRDASSPAAAVSQTAGRKTEAGEQLHKNDAVLFVDCSSFDDSAWHALTNEKPDVGHNPAVVYRTLPSGTEAFLIGTTVLRLSDAVDWV